MIEELIEKLGISRRMLAVFLQTDQGNLSRHENNIRNLPMAAIPQVAQLIAILHTAPPVIAPKPTPAEQDEAMANARWCRVQMVPLQKKLADMQKEYGQASKMLYVLEVYTQKETAPDATMKSWIAGQHYAANRKTENNGWLPQQLLNQKINALEQEALFWEAAAQVYS